MLKRLKYKVVIGWRAEFEFYDPDVAMNFAVTAMKHRSDEDADVIRIEIIRPEDEDTEEPKDQEAADD